MTQIASEDYANKRIYLHLDTTTNGWDPVELYREHRQRRRLNANGERNYKAMVSASGNESKGGGNYTPRRGILASGVRIVPYNGSHVLRQLAEVINTDEGLSDFSLIDRAPLGSGVEVDLELTYDKIEIREVGSSPADIAAAVLDAVVEGSLTLRGVLRICLAGLAATLSGAGTTTIRMRDQADTKDRITATVDAQGNRSAVTLDPD